MYRHRVSAFFLLAITVSAQESRWRIPPHGVLRYQTADVLEAVAADGRKFSIAGSASTHCHPLLFADELVDGQHWLAAPWSLQSIPMWLAWDLRTWGNGGAIDITWPRIDQHGTVHVRGKAAAIDGYGWQTITVRLTRSEVQPLGANYDPEQLRVERGCLSFELDAELIVRRHFDAQLGVIDEFAASLRGGVGIVPGPPYRAECNWRWKFAEALANRFTESATGPLRARVHEACSKVAGHQLRELMRPDAKWLRDSSTAAELPAAILFGLSRAGRRIGDPGIAGGLQVLREYGPTSAHGLAMTILALAGLHAPADERARWAQGAPSFAVPAAVLAEAKVCCQKLQQLSKRVPGKSGTGVYWSLIDLPYPIAFASCTAVRGLDAAARIGVPVETRWFVESAHHLLASALHAGDGAPTRLRAEGAMHPGPTAGATRRSVWEGDTDKAPWQGAGDATAASMAALLCCRRHIKDRALIAAIDAAIAGGWSWLADLWTARHCPAPFPVHHQYLATNTLAMAWLLDESGVRWLGDRDVYFEHAMVRLSSLNRDVMQTTVLDAAAALSLWRPDAVDVTAPITPKR